MFVEHIIKILNKCLSDLKQDDLSIEFEINKSLIEKPQKSIHGDYACTIAMKFAHKLNLKPMDFANRIVDKINNNDEIIDKSWVQPPGFINFSIKNSVLINQINNVIKLGKKFGDFTKVSTEKIQIEFVSVNPTGPLHVGHARGAVIGSTLANVLESAGYIVEREYYINDDGRQIKLFNDSLFARFLELLGKENTFPLDGYVGSYVIDIAKQFITNNNQNSEVFNNSDIYTILSEFGMNYILGSIKEDMKHLKVNYDVWFSEKTLYETEDFNEAIDLLKANGSLIESDGAIWFETENNDNNKVVIRSNGEPTYFASDIAYHYNKFIKRKFSRVIDIWGADHQGQIPFMKSMIEKFGIDRNNLNLLIYQLVTLKRDGEIVRISKRTGDLITFKELLEDVGPDVCRFFFLTRSPESQMEFDIDLAKKESEDNPVYYIQYAYARICSILRLADEKGIDYSNPNLNLISDDSELDMIRKMISLPDVILKISETLGPHHLPHYAMEFANSFHLFYQKCRVISDENLEITKARLRLVLSAKIVLAKYLTLMALNKPEKM